MKNRDIIKRFCLWLSVVLVLGVFVVLTVYSKVKLGTSIVCPINEELGLQCPGCGGTRMIESLLYLDFYQAFRWNPFLSLTIIPIICIYLKQSYLFIVENKMMENIDKIIICYIVLFILFGIIRNINAFSWMQPTLV